MRNVIYQIPKFKGKQRLLSFLDKRFGPCDLNGRFNIHIEGFYSSIQDCAFLRSSSENDDLETLIAQLPPNGVFLDIGANCGYYSALAATRLGPEGTVISVEPSFREYRRLLYAITKNRHSCTWVPVNQACGDYAGIAKLAVDAEHTGVNHIVADGTANQACYIGVTDELVANLLKDEKDIHLVKIDVEGFEMAVLKGMYGLLKQHLIGKLQIEITDKFLQRAGSSKKELYAYMNHLGYRSVVNASDWQYNEVFEVDQSVAA